MVRGHPGGELRAGIKAKATPQTTPAARAAAEAYLQGLADSGDFPNLAGIGTAGLLHNELEELTFAIGLNWLLTGIAADAYK